MLARGSPPRLGRSDREARRCAYEAGRRSRAWLKLKIESGRSSSSAGGPSRATRASTSAPFSSATTTTTANWSTPAIPGPASARRRCATCTRACDRLERQSRHSRPRRARTSAPHWTRPSVVVGNQVQRVDRRRKAAPAGVRRRARRQVAATMSFASPARSLSTPAPRSGRVRARHEAPRRRGDRERRGRGGPAPRTRRRAPRSRRETPRVLPRDWRSWRTPAKTAYSTLPSGELEVSNLAKVFFPSTRHTKGDLMRFYARMAPLLLPAIADRPLVHEALSQWRSRKGVLSAARSSQSASVRPRRTGFG